MFGPLKTDWFPLNYKQYLTTILLVLQFHSIVHAMFFTQDNAHIKKCISLMLSHYCCLDVSKSISFQWTKSNLWLPSCLVCNIKAYHMPYHLRSVDHMIKHFYSLEVSNILAWTFQNRSVSEEVQSLFGYHLGSFAASKHGNIPCHSRMVSHMFKHVYII